MVKDKIIQSATQQILKYGFRKFTIDDIASDLGISKKTVYKYFESKSQIISAVMDTYVEMEKARTLVALQTEGGWIDKFNQVIFSETREKAPNWLLQELQQYFPEEWEKGKAIGEFKQTHMRELLRQGIETGDIRPDINPAIVDMALNKAIGGVFDFDFLNQNDLTLNQAMEEIQKLFLNGILKRNQE